jgi:hypothetical protein
VGRLTREVTQQGPTGGPFLSFASEKGDVMGSGRTLRLEVPTSTFTPELDATHSRLFVHVLGSDGLSAHDQFWSLMLEAPQGQQLLPGTYADAVRSALPGVPGLVFFGNGFACSATSGQFVITEAVYGANASVERFHATFEQHCGGAAAALRGELLFFR